MKCSDFKMSYFFLSFGAAAASSVRPARAELEATEACRWLKATGFPQYAQMYEGKLPLPNV